jgi:DNA-binding NarL/FixJ family response regulator
MKVNCRRIKTISTADMITPIRLAIVDDHQMIRQTWKMVLQRDERITVIAECSSGEEAITCAEKEAPDVMLMDINMSPINGFEATKTITKNSPGVKIIGTSINNQSAYARNLMQMGAKGYVTKNSPSDEMIAAIILVHEGGTYICRDVNDKLNSRGLI